MAAFEREVTGKNSMLSEHLTLSLHIKGLPFEDACAFMMGYGSEEQKKLYECIGGCPLYLSLIDNRKSADENIRNLFLNRNGFIYNDIAMALQKELIGLQYIILCSGQLHTVSKRQRRSLRKREKKEVKHISI